MELVFPTEKWIQELSSQLNQSESYLRSAQDWEGDFIFIIEPDQEYQDTSYLFLQLYHGSSPGAGMPDPGDLPETEFIISAPFSTWKKVIQAKLDPIQGLMTGQLKLEGDLMKVMRYPKAAQEIVSCCARVPTQWKS